MALGHSRALQKSSVEFGLEALGGLRTQDTCWWGTDEVSGESWQLVTAVHDEGDDGLILCEGHS